MSEWSSRIIRIGAGGAIGSVLRYLLAGAVQRSVLNFPIGTLVVNVTGCLAIGFLSERFDESNVDPVIRAAVLLGVLGGYTTFSSFSLETLKLADARQYDLAMLNVITSVVSCLLGVWAGQRLAKWWIMT
jgi:CrcB protein